MSTHDGEKGIGRSEGHGEPNETGRRLTRENTMGGTPIVKFMEGLASLPDDVFQNSDDTSDEDRPSLGVGSLDYDKVEFSKMEPRTSEQMAHMIMLIDKLTFVAGISSVVATAFWIGRSPSTFYHLYSFLSVVLLIGRFIVYRRVKTHYYMFDFCYIANVLSVVVLWVIPLFHYTLSPRILQVLFAFNAGPLLWSIPAMRNSLVLHSFDKLTTLSIHLYPALVSWTLRWHPDCRLQGTCGLDPSLEEVQKYYRATIFELGVVPVFPYAMWLVGYYITIFVIRDRRIREKGYSTVYGYWMANKEHPMVQIVLKFSPAMQPVVYLTLHLTLCWFAMILSYLWWHSFLAHSTLLLIMMLWSAWNGANFYFEVFAHKYIRSLGVPLKAIKKET